MHWRGERPQRVFSLILNKTWIRTGHLGGRGPPESFFINFEYELNKEYVLEGERGPREYFHQF
jgi:hypothetical protein